MNSGKKYLKKNSEKTQGELKYKTAVNTDIL